MERVWNVSEVAVAPAMPPILKCVSVVLQDSTWAINLYVCLAHWVVILAQPQESVRVVSMVTIYSRRLPNAQNNVSRRVKLATAQKLLNATVAFRVTTSKTTNAKWMQPATLATVRFVLSALMGMWVHALFARLLVCLALQLLSVWLAQTDTTKMEAAALSVLFSAKPAQTAKSAIYVRMDTLRRLHPKTNRADSSAKYVPQTARPVCSKAPNATHVVLLTDFWTLVVTIITIWDSNLLSIMILIILWQVLVFQFSRPNWQKFLEKPRPKYWYILHLEVQWL